MCDSRASENMSRNEETSSQESRLQKNNFIQNVTPKPFEDNVHNLDMA